MSTSRNQQRIAAAFEKLFRTYPQFGQGSTPDQQVRDRIERAKVYFEAVAPYSEDDIAAAVEAFLTGAAPGVNPSFPPPAPVVATECRRQRDERLRHEELDRRRHPCPPAPDIAHTPESAQRVRELTREAIRLLEEHGEPLSTTNRERLSKCDDLFRADFVPSSGGVGRISRSLAVQLDRSDEQQGLKQNVA